MIKGVYISTESRSGLTELIASRANIRYNPAAKIDSPQFSAGNGKISNVVRRQEGNFE